MNSKQNTYLEKTLYTQLHIQIRTQNFVALVAKILPTELRENIMGNVSILNIKPKR